MDNHKGGKVTSPIYLTKLNHLSQMKVSAFHNYRSRQNETICLMQECHMTRSNRKNLKSQFKVKIEQNL